MEEKADRRPAYANPENMTCHICGGNQFTWGEVNQNGHRGGQRFFIGRPGRFLPFLNGGEVLTARKCDRCGNVQFFAG